MKKVVAIMGSYRRGRTIDQVTDAILEGARAEGAEVQKMTLLDQHIEFCTNCRLCTQNPGEARGSCPHQDDMNKILEACEKADGLVLAAPVNFYNVNAITRRFMERLTGYAYWPWKGHAPKERAHTLTKRAVIVTSTAMPGFFIPFLTGAPRALKAVARIFGAKIVGKMYLGFTAIDAKQELKPKTFDTAKQLGRKLVCD